MIDAKVNARLNISIALHLARNQTVLWNVEEPSAAVSMVKYYIKENMPFFNRNISDCPCHLNCPNGCVDCPNPICVCGENSSSQNKENLETCKRNKSIDLGQCIIDCRNDQLCENACVDYFKSEYETCPCQVTHLNSKRF